MGWGALSSFAINGNVNIGISTDYSTATKLNIQGSSSVYSQPLVRIEQTTAWNGNYALQVVGYSDFGGTRINGADTGNAIFTTGNNDMGLTTNTGAIKFNLNGAERMRITNTGAVYINNSSLFITPDTTSKNAITIYCHPNSINNSNGDLNTVNTRVACNTTG